MGSEPADVLDLLWHGEALCRALNRAWEAEWRVRELEAAALDVVNEYDPAAVPVGNSASLAVERLASVLRDGQVVAPRMPQDEPEPPALPEPVPDRPDAPQGVVGGYVDGVRRRLDP